MTKRKSLTKKVRFEVFKRDSFSCQYCGDKAPDVILHIDHINPVKEGGDNNILNLITSCQACNAGKGATKISDKSAIIKQQDQLETLNERRIQLEMMLDWRQELDRVGDYKISKIADSIEEYFSCSVSENGRAKIRKWSKKYSPDQILDAAEICRDQYLVFDKDGFTTNESTNKAFNYIPRVCACRIKEIEKPYLKDAYYIKGILKNRISYVNEATLLQNLDYAFHVVGVSPDYMKQEAKLVRNWTEFIRILDGAIKTVEEGND